MAGLRGLQLNIDANLIIDGREFARADDAPVAECLTQDDPCSTPLTYSSEGGPKRSYEPVRNDADLFPPSPGGFVAFNLASFGIEELTIAAGVYGPPRSDRVWPAEGGKNAAGDQKASQRYS
ncbi:MAG: hypothetical protein IIA67_02685, partial [Planctomycetes bacterium]|nr:hypothetical protein [Planctomycetota bacterium]